MKKFATVILTALCATAIATAQPTDQPSAYAPQAAPAQAAAPIDAQPAAAQKLHLFSEISGDLKIFPTV